MSGNPFFTSVTYAPGSLLLYWAADDSSSVTIRLNDLTTGTATSYPASGFTTTIKTTLAATDNWTVQIASADPGSSGSYSAAIPVLTGSPTVTRVQNQTTSLVIDWTPPAGYGGGYGAVLQTKGQSSQSQWTDGLSWTFALETLLSGDSTIAGAQLQQTVSGAITTGPLASYTVQTTVPALTAVDFSDGIALALAWTAPAGSASVTAFLTGGAGEGSRTVTGQTGCSFTGLDSAASYTTWVCASSADGVSLGPPSASYQPILVAPTMTGVLTTGSGLRLTWAAMAGATGYPCYAKVAGGQTTTTQAIGTGYTFTSINPVTAGTTCWMRATGGNGVITGPQTAVYTALVGQPLWSLIAYDAGVMGLTWTPPTDTTEVAGYLITVTGLTPANYSTGNVTTTSIDAVLDPAVSYSATVRTTNGIVQGLPSPALAPLTQAPTSASLGYTAAGLRIAWTAVTQFGVTGYSAALTADGAADGTLTAPASPAIFTTVFAANTRYAAQVRASGTATLGPWSNVAVGPYQTSVAYGFDTQGRLVSEAWADLATIRYGIDSAGNIKTVTPQAAVVPAGAEG